MAYVREPILCETYELASHARSVNDLTILDVHGLALVTEAVKELIVVSRAVHIKQDSLDIEITNLEGKLFLLPDLHVEIHFVFDPFLGILESFDHSLFIGEAWVELLTEVVDVIELEPNQVSQLFRIVTCIWCLTAVWLIKTEDVLHLMLREYLTKVDWAWQGYTNSVDLQAEWANLAQSLVQSFEWDLISDTVSAFEAKFVLITDVWCDVKQSWAVLGDIFEQLLRQDVKLDLELFASGLKSIHHFHSHVEVTASLITDRYWFLFLNEDKRRGLRKS